MAAERPESSTPYEGRLDQSHEGPWAPTQGSPLGPYATRQGRRRCYLQVRLEDVLGRAGDKLSDANFLQRFKEGSCGQPRPLPGPTVHSPP